MASELLTKLTELKKLIIDKNNKEFKKNAVEIINPENVDEAEASTEIDPIEARRLEIEMEKMLAKQMEILIREAIAEEQNAAAEYMKKARECAFSDLKPLGKLFEELASDEIIHAASLNTALELFGLVEYDLEHIGADEAIEVMAKVNEDTDYEKQRAALEEEGEKLRKNFDFVAEYTKNKAEYNREKIVNTINDLILGNSSLDDMMDKLNTECKLPVKDAKKGSEKKAKKDDAEDKKEVKVEPKKAKSEKKSQKDDKKEEK